MILAIKKIIDSFVDISYPKASTEEDEDNVCAYAKEVMSLGLLLMDLFMVFVRVMVNVLLGVGGIFYHYLKLLDAKTM